MKKFFLGLAYLIVGAACAVAAPLALLVAPAAAIIDAISQTAAAAAIACRLRRRHGRKAESTRDAEFRKSRDAVRLGAKTAGH